MDVDTLILRWYTLAQGGNVGNPDVFFKFVAIWVATNALYTSRHSHEVGDAEQVKCFAADPDVVNQHQKLITHDGAYQKAVRVIRERGVSDSRGTRTRVIQNDHNAAEVLKCVYQVRCNLFHGGKLPGNPRDEGLVEAAYTITSKLIAPLIQSAG